LIRWCGAALVRACRNRESIRGIHGQRVKETTITLVRDARTNNDNAANGIDPKMLNLVVGNIEATLPCGRFYLEQIGGAGNIIINVTR